MGSLVPFPYRTETDTGVRLEYFTITDDSLDYEGAAIPCGSVVECRMGEIKWGKLHVVRTDRGEYFVRFIRVVEDTKLELRATHPDYPSIVLPITEVTVLGVVTDAVRYGAGVAVEIAKAYTDKIIPSDPAAPNLILWERDALGMCLKVSDNWERITGISYSELFHGWGYIRAVHPDDRQQAVKQWYAALASGSTYHAEFRYQLATGGFARAVVKATRTAETWLGSTLVFISGLLIIS